MKTVAIYHRTVPNSKNQEKIDLLKNYALGVTRSSDRAIDVESYQHADTDVGVIQGWLGYDPVITPHLKLRNTIINNQLKNKKYVLAVDSNLFLYANTANPLHYLRYSFNGVFPETGIYCDTEIDSSRWKNLSKNLNISLKDWRINGNHILLLLQRSGGWSMGSVDVQDWAVRTIDTIRKYSDRPIIIRTHPGDKKTREIIKPGNPQCRIPFSNNIKISTNVNLLDDLRNCWAAVNYNSSPVVGAAIEGVPIFVCDPIKSQSREVANVDLSLIENPTLLDRQLWVERLAMSHWKFSELKSGECWQHMKKYI